MADQLRSKGAPFKGNLATLAAFTIGAEASNVINVSIQLKNARAKAVTEKTAVEAYLASSPTTLAPATLPNSVAIGTNGVMLRGGGFGAITGLTDSSGGATGNNTIAAIPDTTVAALTAAACAGDAEPSATQVNTALDTVAADIVTKVKAGVDTVVDSVQDAIADLAAKLNEVLVANRSFVLLSTAAGVVDLDITKSSGAATYYLVLKMPDGSLVVSGAITFAA